MGTSVPSKSSAANALRSRRARQAAEPEVDLIDQTEDVGHRGETRVQAVAPRRHDHGVDHPVGLDELHEPSGGTEALLEIVVTAKIADEAAEDGGAWPNHPLDDVPEDARVVSLYIATPVASTRAGYAAGLGAGSTGCGDEAYMKPLMVMERSPVGL